MKRAEKFEKELSEIFKDKISDLDLMEFAWGLESIKQIIRERKDLKTSVDFEKIKDDLIYTFKAELRGEMKVLLGNMIIKAPRSLGSSTIYRLIPQIMDELLQGTVRHEFQKDKIIGKGHYIKAEAAIFLNISVGRIDQLVSEGKLEFMPVKSNLKNKRVILGTDLIKYRKKHSTQKK